MTEKAKINIRLWKTIATIAAVFTFIICILTIANYVQISRIDPVNTETINILVERLSQNPNDTELREQIRELDLLARKAYFTNQWQVRTGGYLILIGFAVLVIAYQMIQSTEKINPQINEDSTSYLAKLKNTRNWVSIGGGLLVVTALLFAFLSHNQLGDTFKQAAGVDTKVIAENTSTEPKQEEPKPEKAEVKQVEVTKPVEETPEPKSEEIKAIEVEAPKEEVIPVEAVKIEKELQPEKVEEKIKVESEEVAIEQPMEEISETIQEDPNKYSADVLKNFASFRGPGSNGIAYQTNVPVKWDGSTGENLLWKTKIPIHGYNSPIIWNDKIFMSGANDNTREVYCFDLNTGELLWTAPVSGIANSPAQSPKTTPDTGHAAPTLTTDGVHVYAIFSNGDVAAFDFQGKMIWGRNLGVPENHYGHSSSLITYKDILIVQFDHRKEAKILGLSVSTGETIWSTPRAVKVSWASPVLVNTGSRWEVILSSDPLIASYNPETGEELWQMDCMSGEVGPSIGYADGIVFGMNEYASLVALKLGDPIEKLWEDDEYLSDVPSPIATDKYLFIATSYGVFICYDAKTGTKYWEAEFDNGFYSSPILVGENIYIIDRLGIVHVFKADKEYISVRENPLGEDSDCTPAFVEGKVVIRGRDHLYCFGQ